MGINIDSISEFGETCLTFAIKIDNIVAIKTLLELGSDINYRNSFGETPLQCSLHSEEIFTILINYGADVSQIRISLESLMEIISRDNGLAMIKAIHPTNAEWYEGESYVIEMDVVTQK